MIALTMFSGLQLGDGTTTNRYQPVAVAGLSSGVVTIALGWVSFCCDCCGVDVCERAHTSGC